MSVLRATLRAIGEFGLIEKRPRSRRELHTTVRQLNSSEQIITSGINTKAAFSRLGFAILISLLRPKTENKAELLQTLQWL
jgi:hypothetical protein